MNSMLSSWSMIALLCSVQEMLIKIKHTKILYTITAEYYPVSLVICNHT